MAGRLDRILARHRELKNRSRGYRFALAAMRVILLSYIGLSALLFGCQSRMIYYPTKNVHSTPKDIRLEYEDVYLEPAAGAKIHAWWIPAEGSRGAVIFCHGNAGNISDRLDSIKEFNGLGLDVFIFDYRGYGQSTGRPNEKRTYEDALAAWKYVTETRGVPPQRIVIFGRSLGAAVAAYLAAQKTPRAVILESSFTSVVDVGKHYYPFLPVRLLTRIRYPVIECVREIKCPILIAHSPEDEIIPYEMGRRLYEAAAARSVADAGDLPSSAKASEAKPVAPTEDARAKARPTSGDAGEASSFAEATEDNSLAPTVSGPPVPHGEAAAEFLQMRGGHNEGFIITGAAYTHGLDEFLTRHLGPRR